MSFWAFDCDGQSWHTLEPMPTVIKRVKAGGAPHRGARPRDALRIPRQQHAGVLALWTHTGVRRSAEHSGRAQGRPGQIVIRYSSFVIVRGAQPVHFIPQSLNLLLPACCVQRPPRALRHHRQTGQQPCQRLSPGWFLPYSLLTTHYSLAKGVYPVRLEAGPETAVSGVDYRVVSEPRYQERRDRPALLSCLPLLAAARLDGPGSELYLPPLIILAINPGGGSTKVGVYRNLRPVFEANIRHSPEDLRRLPEAPDQYELRKERRDVRFLRQRR